RSAESDVLGWVCERAAGRPMAELISELIWAPMGAEHDASLLHDGLGAAVHDGGLCATARDVARFGQMLLEGGLVPDGGGGTRREPQRRHRAACPAAPDRGLNRVRDHFSTADRPGLNLAVSLPTGGFLTTPRPEERGFQPSRAGVPVSAPTAPERTRNV